MPGHKGGVRNFQAVLKEILALLKQERGSHVSTFFDYYGLPENWPGVQQARGKKAREIAVIVETAMRSQGERKMDSSDNPSRFVPYVQMHEVEALLFSDPKVMANVFERPELETNFAGLFRSVASARRSTITKRPRRPSELKDCSRITAKAAESERTRRLL